MQPGHRQSCEIVMSISTSILSPICCRRLRLPRHAKLGPLPVPVRLVRSWRSSRTWLRVQSRRLWLHRWSSSRRPYLRAATIRRTEPTAGEDRAARRVRVSASADQQQQQRQQRRRRRLRQLAALVGSSRNVIISCTRRWTMDWRQRRASAGTASAATVGISAVLVRCGHGGYLC